MKRTLMTLALAALVLPAAALACDGEKHQASMDPKSVTVAELAGWTKAKKATPVDANGDKLRQSEGVIPGAILLTSSSQFDPAKELPKSKDEALVFYCASTKCGASHQAAKKAMEAGYTNVAVLPDGILGWKKAGQPTAKPNS